MFQSDRLNKLDKNYLANSAFDFFQVTDLRSRTGDFLDYDSADMFVRFNRVYEGVASTSDAKRTEDAPNSIKAVHCGEITYTAETSGAGTEIIHRMESIHARELANEIVSFGVWINQDNLQNIKLELVAPTNKDNFGATYETPYIDSTIALDTSGTWVFIPFENIQLDANAKKGLELRITCTNPITLSVLKSFRITGLKMNIGKEARPWTQFGGGYESDYRVCKRYYQRKRILSDWHGDQLGSATYTGQMQVNFEVEMFNVPSNSVEDVSILSGNATQVPSYNTLDTKGGTYYIQKGANAWSGGSNTIVFTAVSDARL